MTATRNDALAPEGDGHTLLSEGDRDGLIPTYVTTRGDLFDAEEQNIVEGLRRRRLPRTDKLLDDGYLRSLHKAMLGRVWRWAGRYRTADTNIGVPWHAIPADMRNLVNDAKAWVEFDTYGRDELAVRFHHRLVAIHPFPNGNGRHGRIAADYLVRALGGEAFSWGANLGLDTPGLRAAYRHALQAADGGVIDDLLLFARS